MRLRLARKLYDCIGTPAESRYRDSTLRTAINRVHATARCREVEHYWHRLLDRIGVDGRAWLLAQSGETGMAFDLLMRQGK